MLTASAGTLPQTQLSPSDEVNTEDLKF